MTSEALQKARAFEAQYGPHIPSGERPAFHLTRMAQGAHTAK